MKSEQVTKNLAKITKLKTMISILPFDELAAQQYGIIRADLEKRGLIIGSNDLLIAAHALRGVIKSAIKFPTRYIQ
jgi:tRNA(fMet)-specific endonuclease VapC